VSLIKHILGAVRILSVCICCPGVVLACTANDMLDLIGSLEAPEGYNQVYGGVKLSPPRPITSMTVDEVLAWQRQASKTAVSSAAGRYQVIRATLNNVVDQGVVGRGELYSSATQDRIGKYLLSQAGYRNGNSSDEVLNRISGVWAALPKVSGAGAGASTYEGFAGNHALIDAASYKKYADCDLDLEEVERASNTIRAGLRFGISFDALIEALARNAEQSVKVTSDIAQTLILLLFSIDLVWRGIRGVMGDGNFSEYVTDTIFRVIVVSICIFILQNGAEIAAFIGRWGAQNGETISGRTGFSLGSWARDKFTIIFKHQEGVRFYPSSVVVLVLILSLFSAIAMALTMAKVVLAYAQLFLVTIVGMFTIAFGGFGGFTSQAKNTVMRLIGIGLEITGLNIFLYLALDIAQEGSSDTYPVFSASMILMLDIFVLMLAWTIPATLAKLARSR
jgi:hypothetical protein